ncbi:Protein SABRE [Hypoxylon texense]
MGGTLRPGASPDFSRFEPKKTDSFGETDTQSDKTLPKISEGTIRPEQDEDTPISQPQEASKTNGADEGDASTNEGVHDTNTNNSEGPPAIEAPQRPQTSAGWFGWLGRPAAPEADTPKDEVTQTEPPKEPESLQESAQPAAPQQPTPEPDQAPAELPRSAKPTNSWFGFWYSSAPVTAPDGSAQTATDTSPAQKPTPKESQDVVMEDAPPPKPIETSQPSASSTWAFWSRDTGRKDNTKSTATSESGELAVIGDGSEANPRRSTSLEVNRDPAPVEEPPLKSSKVPARADSSRRNKRVRPQSMDIDESPLRPGTPQSDVSTKTAPVKPATPSSTKSSAKNLLLPSFRNTYRLKENPSIVKQITQLLLRTQQPPANHVFLAKEPPKIKKAVAIGIHGLFPATYLRPMIGQPTGTSIRFANHCAEAIRRWADTHGCGDCEIEKVALEGEGRIADRVDNLWKLLLNWIDHIRSADLIVLACHSQGVPVGMMLLEKLINLGIITRSKIGVCAMAGVSLGPFPDYKSGMGMLMGSAAELWQFADPESEISKRYQHAVEEVVGYGARVTYIGSIDDQLVPMESAIYAPASHPYIYRAAFIDGRVHAPDFIAHLVGFALKLRNLGISDHGLIRELSVPLAGSLYTGEGHSRLYDDEQVYDLAICHALETTNVPKAPCRIQKQEKMTNPNPFLLPWTLRGLLEEEFVKTELYSETAELLKQFDDWSPSTKALKDVKYRLEAVRSKL